MMDKKRKINTFRSHAEEWLQHPSSASSASTCEISETDENYNQEKRQRLINREDHNDSSPPSSSTCEISETDEKPNEEEDKNLSQDDHITLGTDTPNPERERPINGSSTGGGKKLEYDQQHDLIPVGRLLEEAMSSNGLSEELKNCLEPRIVGNLKQLLEKETEPNIEEVGLMKIARMAYLLQLISPFNDDIDKAGKAVRLLQEGLCLLDEAKGLLRSVVNKLDFNYLRLEGAEELS
ncbi:uncharacterized protein LOC132804297 [Ziziphus jujuba]|uniref:Uncharacterized protein LOC132804297 n=1 Tax=Ziziphus jujuba TaxID=326968 RepID=A0ABM4ACM6_ZIZJJ|nr:uncharacterized protein LOC132804297 [Ziziphus jujuba]